MAAGVKLVQQVPEESFASEAAAGWGFCSNLWEFGDGETGTCVTRTGHPESSRQCKEPFLFKTFASKWDSRLADTDVSRLVSCLPLLQIILNPA